MLTCAAAMRNKHPILNVLREAINDIRPNPQDVIHILEVASGTGEHAAFFAENLPNILIQPSDPEAEKVASIEQWNQNFRSIVLPPLHCDISALIADGDTLAGRILERNGKVDAIICINMVHISPYQCTKDLMTLSRKYLRPGGILFLYGPYVVNGFMVDSNVDFDISLKARNADWGIRDLEVVVESAEAEGLTLLQTIDMPANNLSVIFHLSK